MNESVPKGWQVVNFGDVVNKVNDKFPNRDEWTFDKFVSGNHIDSGQIRITNYSYIQGNEETIGSAFHMRFQPGHVLYGSRRAYLRKGGVIDIEGICSNTTFILQADESKLLQSLLPFIIHTEAFVKHTTDNSHGSTNPFLNWKDIENYKLLLPPIKEQRKITEVLWAIEDNYEKNDKVIEISGKLKNTLLSKLITKGIGHKKFKETELGKVPESWEITTLNQLIEDRKILSHLDGNHGSKYPRSEEFVDSGVPYISANCIVNGQVDMGIANFLTEGRAQQFTKGVAKDGDVLLAHNATVGPTAILKTTFPYVILSTSLTYYRCNPSYIDNEFLCYYLQSHVFQNQLHIVMKQTTRNQVPITTQRKLHFLIPPISEQKKIASKIREIEDSYIIHSTNKTNLYLLKKKIANDILSGKFRIPEEALRNV
ncbi:restriction endonuclease subunit S [Methanomethylovorans sp.]|uniref:restriction endonuclease subunit S n=1 Tax=Methanomethylovorans sp. TaxID=2758717 RepID=UPI00345E6553